MTDAESGQVTHRACGGALRIEVVMGVNGPPEFYFECTRCYEGDSWKPGETA